MDFYTIISLNYIHFPFELLICEVAFLVHKPRKENFLVRLIISLCMYFLFSGFWMYLIEQITTESLIPYIFLYIGYAVLSSIIILACFEIKGLEIVFAIVGGYSTQHMCYALLRIILYSLFGTLSVEEIKLRIFTQFISYAIWSAIIYFVIVRKNQKKYNIVNEDKRIAIIALVLSVAAVGLSVFYSYPNNIELNMYNCILCPAYGILCCALILTMEYYVMSENSMKKERDIMDQLLQVANSQQKKSKEAIDIINIKCHDLKHQINALERMSDEDDRRKYIQEVKEAITIYDAIFQTGCGALDYVLREKYFIGNESRVTFSCMADGELINFMNNADIYALFGNAIDNALERLTKENISERMLSILVKKTGQMILIHLENRCSDSLYFQDELPITDKKNRDYHGFGTKSIRYIAEKYDGELYMGIKDGKFMLDILLPRPN